jgi:hypothetical protein
MNYSDLVQVCVDVPFKQKEIAKRRGLQWSPKFESWNYSLNIKDFDNYKYHDFLWGLDAVYYKNSLDMELRRKLLKLKMDLMKTEQYDKILRGTRLIAPKADFKNEYLFDDDVVDDEPMQKKKIKEKPTCGSCGTPVHCIGVVCGNCN